MMQHNQEHSHKNEHSHDHNDHSHNHENLKIFIVLLAGILIFHTLDTVLASG